MPKTLKIFNKKGSILTFNSYGASLKSWNFELKDKKSRPGRNPKTGEEVDISARRVVTFKPGQKLRARVDTYAGGE